MLSVYIYREREKLTRKKRTKKEDKREMARQKKKKEIERKMRERVRQTEASKGNIMMNNNLLWFSWFILICWKKRSKIY